MEVKCSRLFNKTTHIQNPLTPVWIHCGRKAQVFFFFLLFTENKQQQHSYSQQCKHSEWFHISVTLVKEIKAQHSLIVDACLEIWCKWSRLQFIFIVRWRPLVVVVVMTGAKEEVGWQSLQIEEVVVDSRVELRLSSFLKSNTFEITHNLFKLFRAPLLDHTSVYMKYSLLRNRWIQPMFEQMFGFQFQFKTNQRGCCSCSVWCQKSTLTQKCISMFICSC